MADGGILADPESDGKVKCTIAKRGEDVRELVARLG